MNIQDLNILITGGTGSLGQAIVKYLYDNNRVPNRIALLSRNEANQDKLKDTVGKDWDNVRWMLGDVRSYDRLVDAFQGVDVVIHAAALKRVNKGLYNPEEIMDTNILGTRNVLRAARQVGVGRVVLVSSDKAVEPTNIYGVSKSGAEALAVNDNVYGRPRGTISSVVRYGNVLGSRGSVTWIWNRQLVRKEPFTMTAPEMTRFVITFNRAVETILLAMCNMKGGEIYIPRLNAISLLHLFESIEFPSGSLKKLEIVGPRLGGEKYHEVLWNKEEQSRMTYEDVVKLFCVHPHHVKGSVAHMPELQECRSSLTAEKLTLPEMKAVFRTHHPREEP